MGKQGGSGGSVYNQSANAFGQAGNTFGGAGDWFNRAGNAYNNAGSMFRQASQGYNPSQGVAASAANPANISTGIQRYMNPYTTSVIQGAQGDVQRMVDQQQAGNAARASSQGAFGGSRAGIVEALTNSEGQRNLGQIASNLRNTGFNTAAGLAGQDIQNDMSVANLNAQQQQQMNLANLAARNTARQFGSQQELGAAQGLAGVGAGMGGIGGGVTNLGTAVQGLGQAGFNIGQAITDDQMQQGGLQQALVQQIMNLAGGQYGNFMQGPQNQLSLLLSSLGMNPLTAATTTTGTSTPGVFDYLSLAGQTAGSIYGGKGG